MTAVGGTRTRDFLPTLYFQSTVLGTGPLCVCVCVCVCVRLKLVRTKKTIYL